MVVKELIEFCCCQSCCVFTGQAATACVECWDWLILIEGEKREHVHSGTQGNYLQASCQHRESPYVGQSDFVVIWEIQRGLEAGLWLVQMYSRGGATLCISVAACFLFYLNAECKQNLSCTPSIHHIMCFVYVHRMPDLLQGPFLIQSGSIKRSNK